MEEWGLATSADIARAAEIARERRRIGMDTEFMSEGRYRPLLCLVQIAIDDSGANGGGRIWLIDMLDRVDIAPLAELLADPAIEVVLHAGRQDVPILRRVWDTEVKGIFDTQIAAGFAGASAQTGQRVGDGKSKIVVAVDGQDHIAQMGQGDRGVAGADAAGILGEGAVFDAKGAVLDAPMGAGEFEQPVGAGRLFG